jgi:hypothetical protein
MLVIEENTEFDPAVPLTLEPAAPPAPKEPTVTV